MRIETASWAAQLDTCSVTCGASRRCGLKPEAAVDGRSTLSHLRRESQVRIETPTERDTEIRTQGHLRRESQVRIETSPHAEAQKVMCGHLRRESQVRIETSCERVSALRRTRHLRRESQVRIETWRPPTPPMLPPVTCGASRRCGLKQAVSQVYLLNPLSPAARVAGAD